MQHNVTFTIKKKKIELTPKHKEDRLSFAKQHVQQHTNFEKWIFSDEKRFSLDGPDNNGSFEILGTPSPIRSRRQQGGGAVMIFGAVASNGKLFLKVNCSINFSLHFVFRKYKDAIIVLNI